MARDELGLRHVRAVAMYGPEQRVWAPPLSHWDRPREEKVAGANWQLIDLSIERLLDLGLKPIYTTCFTPPGFSDRTETCWPDRNPIGMPRDLSEWEHFVAEGLRHHIRRFGLSEVRSWYLECWNEPNLSGFFAGTQEEFFRLWSATWKAVKSVDAELRLGGPSTARGEWIEDFLEWTRRDGTAPDYLITHVYNNDSESEPLSPFDGPASHRVKDSPSFASGVIRGVRSLLDRRGWTGEVHWNEWGRSWFPHDPRKETPLEAAFVAKTMIEVSQKADRFAYWCLSDIYDQIGFQSAEFQGHYGMLSLHGLRKPAWFAHQLLGRLGTASVSVSVTDPNVSAVATRDGGRLAVLLAAYPESPDAAPSTGNLAVQFPAGIERVTATSIDEHSGNVVARWREAGSPPYPTREEIVSLRGGNGIESVTVAAPGGVADIRLACPGVILLEAG